MNSIKLCQIGNGHFGGALSQRIHVTSIHSLAVANDMSETHRLASEAEILLLGRKPNQVGTVLREIKDSLNQCLIISFAAAVPREWMQAIVGNNARVVRAMTDIDFMQVMSQRDEESTKLLAPFSTHQLIQANSDEDIDAMTTLIGCLPGLAAWQYLSRPNKAELWLMEWSKIANDKIGIPEVVCEAIQEKVLKKKDFAQQIRTVATPGGVTDAMIMEMNRGMYHHEHVFNSGMSRIKNIAESL